MAGGLQLSGLASGLDTQSIIAQLMTVERLPRARFEREQAAVTARQNALKDIAAKLKSLRSAANDLQSAATWAPTQKITSSDAARVSATLTGTQPVVAGTYDISVSRLATGAEQTWSWQAKPVSSPLTITAQNGTSYTVNLAANATVDDAVAQINADSSLPVTALNFNGQILFRSRATGVSSDFTVSGTMLKAQTSTTAGQDAAYSVNGVSYTSSTNVTTQGVAGAELTLSGLTGTTPVSLTVTQFDVDKDTVKTKLKAFVEAYNAASDLIRGKLEEKRVPNAQNTVDAAKGALFGDNGVSRILSDLRNTVMNPLSVGNATTMDELREIGIGTGAASSTILDDNVNGKLAFDEAKFDAAWESDRLSVERVLQGTAGVDGFAQKMTAVLDPLTNTGGLLDGRISAADGELTRLKDSLSRMDDRLARKEQFLRKQFTALETALAKAQQQQTGMTSGMTGLPAAG